MTLYKMRQVQGHACNQWAIEWLPHVLQTRQNMVADLIKGCWIMFFPRFEIVRSTIGTTDNLEFQLKLKFSSINNYNVLTWNVSRQVYVVYNTAEQRLKQRNVSTNHWIMNVKIECWQPNATISPRLFSSSDRRFLGWINYARTFLGSPLKTWHTLKSCHFAQLKYKNKRIAPHSFLTPKSKTSWE